PMMRMLERPHAHAARGQARDRLGDQRGLARPAPAGKPDDAHVASGWLFRCCVHGVLIAKRRKIETFQVPINRYDTINVVRHLALPAGRLSCSSASEKTSAP